MREDSVLQFLQEHLESCTHCSDDEFCDTATDLVIGGGATTVRQQLVEARQRIRELESNLIWWKRECLRLNARIREILGRRDDK